MNCPYCGTPMTKVFVITNGGVWLSESRKRMQEHLGSYASETSEGATSTDDTLADVHCVIGDKGYRTGTWPKDGMFCSNCYSFIVKPFRSETTGVRRQLGSELEGDNWGQSLKSE